MKRTLICIATVLIAVIIATSCVKPFNPAVSTVNQNILVVEGFINTGGDTTKYVLSHTVTIGSKNTSAPETGATVTVEDAAGNTYTLPETTTKGSYASKGALALTTGKQYRLRIKTTGGKTYLSDLVDSKAAPAIDSIGRTYIGSAVAFYVNSHDNSNQTLYYKYGFSETWKFHSQYQSGFISNGKNGATVRTAAQMAYYCYGSDSSTFIQLNSTAALAKDVVYQFTFNTQSDTLEKFELRYSLLLSQQALTKDGYAFWQNMKKNTEQLGSIFDAQPSAIAGNIHNISNTAEPVIGFISAGTIQKKRIYINRADLPAQFVPGYPSICHVDESKGVDSIYSPPGPAPPYWAYYWVIQLPSPNRIISYDPLTTLFTSTTAICADCTLRGTVTQPSFWKP